MRVFDGEAWPTHGGSLRVFACHAAAAHPQGPAVARVRAEERAGGLFEAGGYAAFAEDVVRIQCATLALLAELRLRGQTVCAYGAVAKGNTFLNYCGIGPELMQVVADRSPHKQGTLLPGSRIPVVAPEALLARRPDYVLILPWNRKDEIAGIRDGGGRFVAAIPRLAMFGAHAQWRPGKTPGLTGQASRQGAKPSQEQQALSRAAGP